MNIKEFARRVIDLSPQIIKSFVHHEHNYLSRGEITLPQFWALEYLHRNGKSKMNSLTKYLSISAPATTGLIDRLMVQGLVSRKDDPGDRRVVWIELTSSGNNIVKNINKQKTKVLINIFGKISQGDRDHYLNILEQIIKIANSMSATKNQKQIKNN